MLRLPSLTSVSRIVGHSSSLDMNLSLDVAVDIYPVTVAQNLTVQIASSLGRTAGDGEGGDNDRDAWRLEGGGGLADEFDYVMYGKVSLAAACVIDCQALMNALWPDLQVRRLTLRDSHSVCQLWRPTHGAHWFLSTSQQPHRWQQRLPPHPIRAPPLCTTTD